MVFQIGNTIYYYKLKKKVLKSKSQFDLIISPD